jgi:signal peptidase II
MVAMLPYAIVAVSLLVIVGIIVGAALYGSGGKIPAKLPIFLSIFLIGVALDQGTKWLVRAHIDFNRALDSIHVIPGWFDIVHAENPGAAGGMFRDFQYRHQLFLLFTVVAVFVIVDLWRRLPSKDAFMSFTLGLILSGAVGNAIDRILKQTVTDFLRVYTDSPSLKPWLIEKFGTNEYPSFNVADSALVVGVLLFLIHYLFLEKEEPKKAEDQAPVPPAA